MGGPMGNQMGNPAGNPMSKPMGNPMSHAMGNPLGNNSLGNPMGRTMGQTGREMSGSQISAINNQSAQTSNAESKEYPEKTYNQAPSMDMHKKPFLRGQQGFQGNFSGGFSGPYKKPHYDYFPQQGHHQNPHSFRNYEQSGASQSQEGTEFSELSKKPQHFKAGYKPQNYKTVPCRFFHSTIGCPRGEECHFIHDYNYMGVETPNMHKYVRPLSQLSHNQERNQRNMLLYGHMSSNKDDEGSEKFAK